MATPEREDQCPRDTACTEPENFEPRGGVSQFCMPTCEPESSSNPCADRNGGLACDPKTRLWTGHSATVCGVAACSGSPDCPTSDIGGAVRDCDGSTGICFVDGASGGGIGGPCDHDADCGIRQLCIDDDFQGKSFEDGYCTIVGCEFGGLWQCPTGSSCFRLGSSQALSVCLAVGCSPTAEIGAPPCTNDCIPLGDVTVCWRSP